MVASIGTPIEMEYQLDSFHHSIDTPRRRLSLNDLEQLNAARSETFQPEKLQSPRLSCESLPVMTPRQSRTLGAANLTVHGTSFFQSATPRSHPQSTDLQQSLCPSVVPKTSMDSESLPEELLLSEDTTTEGRQSQSSQLVFDFESPRIIRESLFDRIKDIKSFCIDTGKVELEW